MPDPIQTFIAEARARCEAVSRAQSYTEAVQAQHQLDIHNNDLPRALEALEVAVAMLHAIRQTKGAYSEVQINCVIGAIERILCGEERVEKESV